MTSSSPRVVEGKVEESSLDDGSKATPGTSSSTWKPNIDAPEWKPSFGASHSADGVAPASGGGVSDVADVRDAGDVEADVKWEGEDGAGEGEDGEKKDCVEVADSDERQEGGEEAERQAEGEEKKDVTTAVEGKADGDAAEEEVDRVPGGDEKVETGGAVEKSVTEVKEERPNGEAANRTEELERERYPKTPAKVGIIRYDVDVLLKLRPKPEATPRPPGLNPPERVDILWDGKEPTPPKAASSIRGGIRPLPPLGSRQGSRGFGESRGALPMIRDSDGRRSGSGRDDHRHRPGGAPGGDGRRDKSIGRGRRQQVDTAPALEDCEPIQINEATRWKPQSLEGRDPNKNESVHPVDPEVSKLSVEEVLRKANAILNKMTLEKFGKLSESFMKLGLRDEDVVAGVIDILIDKAQMEPHFSSMYADLCERIARTPIPGLGEDPVGKDASKGSRKFRKMLLVKCQKEYAKDWQGIYVAIQNDPNLAEDEKTEREFVTKKKYTGHMRFVGELYKVELLKEKHVHAAIHDLFGSSENPDEERLECMVKLLQTCGKKLDQTASPDTLKEMKRFFKRVAKMSESRQVSSRIRFMLRDLIELRKNDWVPRREEEKAKTMQELHNDIAKEEESKNRAAGRSSTSSSHHGSSGAGNSALRPGSGDNRASGTARPDSSLSSSKMSAQAPPKPKDDDGWEFVPKRGKGGGGGGMNSADGWNQVTSSRSRSSNPGSDDRRGASNAGAGGSGGGGGSTLRLSGFAALENDKDKKKKKKDSKDKKDKSTKSAKEKDKEKKKTSSSSSKGGSKSSSSRAASSASEARPASPPASRGASAVEKPPLPPPAAAAAGSTAGATAPADPASSMTEDKARKIGKEMVAEYDVSGELQEACTCLSEVHAAMRWAAVSEAINDSMERKQKHRDSLGVVIMAAAKGGILDQGALTKALQDVLEVIPDVSIDVPQAEKYVAAVVAPLALEGHIALGPLLAEPCEGLLEGGKAASFAVIVMGQVKVVAQSSNNMSAEEASARLKEILGGALDLPKLASMLPVICRGKEDKAVALLEREGVSL